MEESLLSLLPQMLIALFIIMNPFPLLGLYLSITDKFSSDFKNKLLIAMTVGVNVILLTFLFSGKLVLDFFGIDLASFSVAGGIIIFFIGLSMVKAKTSDIHHKKEEGENAKNSDSPVSIGVVPFAIPILAGPGTISIVMTKSQMFSDFNGYLAISLGIIIVSLIVYVVFRFSGVIVKKLGNTGLNIITRVMGIFLIAISIDMLAKGIRELFPILG